VSGIEVGTPRHFEWLRGIVIAVLVLNLIDAVLTLLWVNAGLAEEANSLMRTLVNHHPVLFTVVKISLVSAGSWFLWTRRQRPAAVVGIFVAFIAYYWILVYHLAYSSILVRNMVAK
jgi:hypothetical protein